MMPASPPVTLHPAGVRSTGCACTPPSDSVQWVSAAPLTAPPPPPPSLLEQAMTTARTRPIPNRNRISAASSVLREVLPGKSAVKPGEDLRALRVGDGNASVGRRHPAVQHLGWNDVEPASHVAIIGERPLLSISGMTTGTATVE